MHVLAVRGFLPLTYETDMIVSNVPAALSSCHLITVIMLLLLPLKMTVKISVAQPGLNRSQPLSRVIYIHAFHLHNLCGQYCEDLYFRKEVKYLAQSPRDQWLVYKSRHSDSESTHLTVSYSVMNHHALQCSYKQESSSVKLLIVPFLLT